MESQGHKLKNPLKELIGSASFRHPVLTLPSVVASGLGSYENVAFPMVDRYFSGRCQFQEK